MALLLAEATLRFTMPNPLLAIERNGFISLPIHGRGELTVAGRKTTIQSNNLGLRRDADIGAPLPHERRILFLGDSFPFGFGVEAEEAFPALVEQRLAASLGVPVTVVNASFPGAGTVDQLPALQHLRPMLQPELVVSFAFLGNDFVDNWNPQKAVIDGHVIYGPMARLLQRSWRARLAVRSRVAFLVEDLLRRRVPWLAMDMALPAGGDAAAQRHLQAEVPAEWERISGLYMDAVPETTTTRLLMDRAVDALVRLRDSAAPLPFLVVVIPSVQLLVPGTYDAELQKAGLDPATHVRGTVQTKLRQRCAEHGIELVDVTELFAAQDDPDALYLPGDGHLSLAGHDLVARHLQPMLEARLRR